MMQKAKEEFERAFLMCVCIFLLAAIGATTLFLYTDIFCEEQAEAQLIRREAQVLPSVRFKAVLSGGDTIREAWTAYLVQRQSKRSDIFKE